MTVWVLLLAIVIGGGIAWWVTTRKPEILEAPEAPAAPLPVPTPAVYTCPACGAVFTSEAELENHIVNAHPLEPTVYACPHCGATFTSAVELATHIAMEHPEPSPPVEEPVPQPITYTCPHCSMVFASESELIGHIKEKHPQQVPTVPEGVTVASEHTITTLIAPDSTKTGDIVPVKLQVYARTEVRLKPLGYMYHAATGMLAYNIDWGVPEATLKAGETVEFTSQFTMPTYSVLIASNLQYWAADEWGEWGWQPLLSPAKTIEVTK